MILVHSGIFTWANFDYVWRHDLRILCVSNAPKYILNRITGTEPIKKELRTAITIMIFFYYRPLLLLLAGCMQLNYGMVLGISKDDDLWPLGFLQKGMDCMFLLFRSMVNLNLFFCQGAYRQLEDNVWVFFCLFFLLFLTDFRTNEFTTVTCCSVSFPKSHLKMPFC